MKTTYKNINIDHKDGSACIMPQSNHAKFKGFASDETKDGKSAFDKAKDYIDSI